jgi:hypothetical protein
MTNATDNTPKNGDFVRYIEQLEKEQLKATARMMQQTQARSPGEVRPAQTTKPAARSSSGGAATAAAPKLTAQQAQKVFETLNQGKSSTEVTAAMQRVVSRVITFIAILIGVIVFARFMDIPVWIAVPVVLGIWASYFKKSKTKTET